MTADPNINRIIRAWTNEGPNPQYHQQQQQQLRTRWPTLYHAIVRLVEQHAREEARDE